MNIKLIFKYYWPHVKKYKKTVTLTFVFFGLAVIGTDIFSPLLYKRVMDIITGGQSPEAVAGILINTVLLLGGLIFLYNTIFRLADYAMAYSQSRILKDLADDAFKRISRHSYEFFSGNFTGSLVAKVRRYVNSFEQIHDRLVFTAWMKGLGLIFAFAVLTYFSIILGLILFIWITLYIALTAIFVKKKFKKDLLTAEANSEVTAFLSDAITNILNIKMFSTYKRERSDFAKTTDIEEKRRRDAWYFQNLQFIFQGYFVALFEFLGMFAAVYLWINGVISAGTIILMQIYIFSVFNIVWGLGRDFTRTMRAFAEAKEMVDIFEKPLAVLDPKDPEECRINTGKIEMKNITFYYEKGGAVFGGFSLNIAPGEKVGLVGPSGGGKTTITKLLLRFADIQKGEILIDGQDIRKISQDNLRSKIAYVPQDPLLFHRSLRENIAYARPGASEEEIIDAAKRSHAYEFIKNLPQDFETFVGERGIKLSGGERQRVAIARAMLKDTPILILDEATSSLDSISEKIFKTALMN